MPVVNKAMATIKLTMIRFIVRTPGDGGGRPTGTDPLLNPAAGMTILGPSTAVLASIDPGSMCLTLLFYCTVDAK